MLALPLRERESALLLARVSRENAGIAALPRLLRLSDTPPWRLLDVRYMANGGHDGRKDDQNSIQLPRIDGRRDVLTSLYPLY